LANQEDVTELLNRLASAPGRYAAALSRLEDADSVVGSQPGEWSPAETFAHVRASCDILEPRIMMVLVRDNPQLLAYDDAKWSELARYTHLPLIDSLELMRLRRKELVGTLSAINLEGWERAGTHEMSGPQTVLDIARHIADHDDEHITQIEEAVRRGGTR
jgi:hypothetical protein